MLVTKTLLAMRTLAAVAVIAVFAVTAAGAAAEPAPIGLAGLPRTGNTEEEQVAKDLGLNFIIESTAWDEPKEGDYAWTSSTDDAFGERLKKLKTQGYTICVTLQVIDDEKKRMPFYLEGRPFDDPRVLTRWTAFLKEFATRYGDSIDYLNLGQKVNGYFAKHAEEWPAFVKFVAAGAFVVHKEKPKVGIGVVLKDTDEPAKYWRDLAPACSHLALTYTVPCSVLTRQPTAQALDPRQTVFFAKTLDTLMRQSGGRKLLLTELGCATHASLDSSPETQAQFLTTFFAWLRQAESRVAAVSYICDKDLPYEATQAALKQMFGDEIMKYRGFIRLITSLGLRYEDGKKKPGYEAFKKAIEQYRGKR